MRLCLVHARVWLLVLLLAVVGFASVQLAAAPAVQNQQYRLTRIREFDLVRYRLDPAHRAGLTIAGS